MYVYRFCSCHLKDGQLEMPHCKYHVSGRQGWGLQWVAITSKFSGSKHVLSQTVLWGWNILICPRCCFCKSPLKLKLYISSYIPNICNINIYQYTRNTVDGRSPAPPGMQKNPVNNGINYLSTNWLAGFLPSTVWTHVYIPNAEKESLQGVELQVGVRSIPPW